MEVSKINTKHALIACSLLVAVSATTSTFAQALKITTGPTTRANPIGILPPPPLQIPLSPPQPLDSGLYTTYTIWNSYTNLNWIVCGSTKQSEGCYDSGSLGPFGKIGAVIAGRETTDYSAGTVTQNIYVVDEASNGGTGVALYVYQKTDVITSSFDTSTTALINAMPLSLTGGTDAITYMAGNDNCLFIGTNKSAYAVKVQKSNFASSMVGGFSPPSDVSSITTDRYGYVTVTFGSSNASSGFYTFGPSCNLSEDGGGGDFMLNPTNGVSTGSTGNIISAVVKPNFAARLQVHPKQQTTP